MNNIQDVKEQCTGCGNCRLVCSHKAIIMAEDQYGFIRPCVDKNNCTDCGACLKVCPALAPQYNNMISSMMARSNDESSIKSASGGVFAGIALQMLKNNNMYVCGAAFDNGTFKQILINSTDELYRLQGSKYVQSQMGDINERIFSILQDGGSVLFGGTPCQCEAVLKYLDFKRCSTNNLFLIDLICHGVPPYKFLRKELHDYTNINNIDDINFRYRHDNSKKNKSSFTLLIKQRNPSLFINHRKQILISLDKSPYYCAFMQGKILRDSCYECKFTQLDRVGDITIGDCGINDKHNFYPGESVSTILINTQKGKKLFDMFGKMFNTESIDIHEEIMVNPQLKRPFNRSDDWQQARDDFANDNMSVKELRKKYAQPFKISSYIRSILQRILPQKLFISMEKIGRRCLQK